MKMPAVRRNAVWATLACVLALTTNAPGLGSAIQKPAAGRARLPRPELALQIGHLSIQPTLDVSPDGRFIATGSWDTTVKIWIAATGEVWRTLHGHTFLVKSVAFSPDGRMLASASNDGTVRLWNPVTGELYRSLHAAGDTLESVAFSHDGRTVAAGGRKIIYLWDSRNGRLRRTLRGHSRNVVALAFSPEGRLASASWDKTVRLWETTAARPAEVLYRGDSDARAVAFSPDGRRLAAGTKDGVLRVWDLHSHTLEHTDTHSREDLRAVCFSPDGRLLAGGDWSGRIRVWNASTWALLVTAKMGKSVPAVAFIRRGGNLVSGDISGSLAVWRASTGEAIWRSQGYGDSVWSVAVSPDGNLVASGEKVGVARLWNAHTGELEHTLVGHKDMVHSVLFLQDGKELVTGSYDGTVRFWDTRTGQPRGLLNAVDGWVLGLALSPDGRLLAAGGVDGATGSPRSAVLVWDCATHDLLWKTLGSRGGNWTVAFSPDSHTLASGSSTGEVALWDPQTGYRKSTFVAQPRAVRGIAFSPDGHLLVTGGHDPLIRVWHLPDQKLFRTFPGDGEYVRSFSFVDGGRLLAAGGMDSVIRVWNFKTGQLVSILDGHEYGEVSLARSPDGRLVSGSADETIRFWDARRGRLLCTLLSLPPLDGEDVANSWMAITPEGYYDSSAGADRFVRWRVGDSLFPVEAYETAFRRPHEVRSALSGMSIIPPAGSDFSGATVPPRVTFVAPSNGVLVPGSSVRVEVAVLHDRPVSRLELLVNGRPTHARPIDLGDKPINLGDKPIVMGDKPVELGDKPIELSDKAITPPASPASPNSHSSQVMNARLFESIVQLPPDSPRVTVRAIAWDEVGLRGSSSIEVVHPVTAAGTGALHVLAVGVSQYANPHFNLRFAAEDAKAFERLWTPDVVRGLFSVCDARSLINADATSSAVAAALTSLGSTAAENDTVILFLSGHGLQLGEDRFYFGTYGIDPGTAATIAATGLSWDLLESSLARLKAHRVLVFLDACHSGGLLGSRQASAERMAELLARRGGVMVFCSSRGSEFSYEVEEAGHGAFTQAILEAVGQGKADLDLGSGRTGAITVDELLTYLRARVPELTDHLQNPTCPLLRYFDDPAPIARAP